MKLSIGFNCVLIIPIVYGFLNEESVKEQGCVANPTVTELNFTWVQSVPEWYFPLWNKLELYRSAADIKNVSISDIQEDELYYDMCFTFKIGNGNISTTYGFNGQQADYVFIPVSSSVFKWFAVSRTFSAGMSYITLTDNKTFMLYMSCWDDGLASWTVASTTNTLDEKTVQEIYAHVKSFGFQEKYFTKLRYETCTS